MTRPKRSGRPRLWIAPVVLAFAVAVAALSCGDAGTEPTLPTQVATTVTVTPDSATLAALGSTVQLAVEVRDQNGWAMDGAPVTWSSSDAGVVGVDAEGLATAVANGSATVTAASGTASGTAAVMVEQEAESVAVAPDSFVLVALADTVRLAAEVRDQNGWVVDGASFTWSSSDVTVVGVDTEGLVTAVANGSAKIAATAGSASGNAVATVRQVAVSIAVSPETARVVEGNGLQLAASPVDANGHEAGDAEVSWSSADASVARVDHSGFVTGAGVGQTEVTATSGEASTGATVAVTPPPAVIVITPPGDPLDVGEPFAMVPGDSVALVAEALDAGGNHVPVALAWSSSDPAVAFADSAGLVVGRAYGTATLTARWTPSGRAGPSEASSAPAASAARALRDLATGIAGMSADLVVQVTNPDRAALVALFNSTGGKAWTNNRNWLSDRPIGAWHGVKTWEYGRVVSIRLYNNGLTGPIPPELGKLSNLRSLYLWDNDLTGPIPSELGKMSTLRSLLLQDNLLTGPIPSELGKMSNLYNLLLQDNRLTGRIPDSFLELDLAFFYIVRNNGLCVPNTPAFLEWLPFNSAVDFCASGGSTGASADREWDATLEKVRLR